MFIRHASSAVTKTLKYHDILSIGERRDPLAPHRAVTHSVHSRSPDTAHVFRSTLALLRTVGVAIS